MSDSPRPPVSSAGDASPGKAAPGASGPLVAGSGAPGADGSHTLGADAAIAGALLAGATLLVDPALCPGSPDPLWLATGGAVAGLWFARGVRRTHDRRSGIRVALLLWNGVLAAVAAAFLARELADADSIAVDIAYRFLYFRLDALPWSPRLLWLAGQVPENLVTALVAIAPGLIFGPLAGQLLRVLRAASIDRRRRWPVRWLAWLAAALVLWRASLFMGQEESWMSRTAERVHIPAGWFVQGYADGLPDETPPRKVYLDDFDIDRHETTIEQYWQFVDSLRHRPPADWDDPARPFTLRPHEAVEGLSWNDAAEYAAFRRRRLPTEAEWERAARGHAGRLYPWGDTFDPTAFNGGPAHCPIETPAAVDRTAPRERTGCYGVKGHQPADVGSFPRDTSQEGLTDCAGNVAEWVLDWYSPTVYQTGERPVPPSTGTERVYRGGDYGVMSPAGVRLTRRYHAAPGIELWGKGVRTAGPVR